MRATVGQLLGAILQFESTQGHGPTSQELALWLNVKRTWVQDQLAILRRSGAVDRDSNFRFTLSAAEREAREQSSLCSVRRLTSAELRRLSAGEPSSGSPPRLASLPSIYQQSAPERRRKHGQRGRLRVTDDEIHRALAIHPTRMAAAAAVGLSPAAMTYRAHALGYPRCPQGRRRSHQNGGSAHG